MIPTIDYPIPLELLYGSTKRQASNALWLIFQRLAEYLSIGFMDRDIDKGFCAWATSLRLLTDIDIDKHFAKFHGYSTPAKWSSKP